MKLRWYAGRLSYSFIGEFYCSLKLTLHSYNYVVTKSEPEYVVNNTQDDDVYNICLAPI